jgi:hypothetical protein
MVAYALLDGPKLFGKRGESFSTAGLIRRHRAKLVA